MTGVQDASAVGPDDPDAIVASNLLQLLEAAAPAGVEVGIGSNLVWEDGDNAVWENGNNAVVVPQS